MHIELLWIIPILAFVFFIFIITFYAQRRANPNVGGDLSKEVARFNNGLNHIPSVQSQIPENRINELEHTMTLITQSLSNQQKVIEKFQQENSTYNAEVNELKKKLRELYKEYDIVLSENYSLRAKVKKLLDKPDSKKDLSNDSKSNVVKSASNSTAIASGKLNLRLYDDTRLMNMQNLEDTSEIDVSELHK